MSLKRIQAIQVGHTFVLFVLCSIFVARTMSRYTEYIIIDYIYLLQLNMPLI